MEERRHSGAASTVQNVTWRTDRVLVGIPVLVATGLGLAFGLTRFVVLLIQDLQEPVDDWRPVGMFVLLIGSAAAVIVLASALVGLMAGAALKAAVLWSRRAGGQRHSGAV